MMLGPVFQLGGDSYTLQMSVGDPLRRRLERHATSWTGQAELIRAAGGDRLDPNIALRLSQLEEAMADPVQAITIARSSGARVATLLAARRQMRAVICLGYPFHHPQKAQEPERYAHLAHILTPTLILQGSCDVYGGREILEKIRLLAGGHRRVHRRGSRVQDFGGAVGRCRRTHLGFLRGRRRGASGPKARVRRQGRWPIMWPLHRTASSRDQGGMR
jgi:hypothetical protein